MAEFITKCEQCDIELQIQDEWIGMEIECPACQNKFIAEKPVLQITPAVSVDDSAQSADDNKVCPLCGGTIKAQAVFCKHCKSDLPQNIPVLPEPEALFIFICPECRTVSELPETMKDEEYKCPCCCEISIAKEAIERDCPRCGEKIKIKATVCKHCKQTIPHLSVDRKYVPGKNIPSPEEDKMFIFICPECNTVAELPEETKNKEYECPCCCETSIAKEAEERNCPSCGEKIKIKASICKHCKQNVKSLLKDKLSPLPSGKGIASLTKLNINNIQRDGILVNIFWIFSMLCWISGMICCICKEVTGVFLLLAALLLSALALALKKNEKFELQDGEKVIKTCRLMDTNTIYYYTRMTNQRLVLCAVEYPFLPLFIAMLLPFIVALMVG